MIKPLLRILPSLSGNVRLTCALVDIKGTNDGTDMSHSPSKTWEANIRGAKIQPCTAVLHQRDIHAGLLTSSWEYDLRKFYQAYSDIFYNTCFEFDKADMLLVDKHAQQQLRAQDFEWGAKRTSIGKDADEISFFAPIYIDDVKDIPAYFLVTVTIHTATYDVVRNLRINLANNGDSKFNYIYKYLDKYCKQLDDNVIFCTPLTNQATYYGIDLWHGGFVKAIDNMAERIYHRQNTINNFDASIIRGWERNRVAMKQVVPLCFNFTIQDFLTEQEQIRFRNLPCDIHGAYYTMDGKQLPMYDFSHDYVQYEHDILHMDDITGVMTWGNGEVPNIMDVGFPSLNDYHYIKYEYTNKLDPWYCRWKMKLSDDDHPYVTNLSWAFSKNQKSNYRYGMYPSTYNSIHSLAYYIERDDTYNYNLLFPLGYDRPITGRYAYAHFFQNPLTGYAPYAYLIKGYKTILENFCTNWFSVVPEVDDSIYEDESIWRDVNDDCVYYKGILYDLRNIYSNWPDGQHVDKFAVIIRPVPDIYDESNIGALTFTDYTLYRKGAGAVNPNVVSDKTLIDDILNGTKPISLYEDIRLDDGVSKINTDEIRLNEIFTFSYEMDGEYVDLLNLSYIDENGAYHEAVADYYDMTTAWLAYDYPSIEEQSKEMAHHLLSEIQTTDEEFVEVLNTMQAWYDDITPEITYSYLQWPIYRSLRVAYDGAYVLDDFGYVDGTAQLPDGSYLNPVSYSYCNNAAILALNDSYSSYENTRLAIAYLQDISYIHHNGDLKTVMTPSAAMSTYMWEDEEGHEQALGFSYLALHSPSMNEIIYGTTIYSKLPFVLASYNGWWGHDFDPKCLAPIAQEHGWSSADLAYWTNVCRDIKFNISKNVKEVVKPREYEYVPIQMYGGDEVAFNIMRERCKLTGRMYGDTIPEDKVEDDKDVLWADPYNLDALLKAAGKEYDESLLRPMYVKILNKVHLFYYYAELYKDAYRKRKSGWTTNEWYKDLYVVEKKLIYDPERDSVPEVKLVYTPLGRWLNFPEFYKDGKKDAGNEYRRFMAFYNELLYDSEDDLFSLPGKWDYSLYDPETDTFGIYTPRMQKFNENSRRSDKRMPSEDYTLLKFELAFKKDMYRVGRDLWDATNMSADLANYRDVYFYRVQSALEHDQKYGYSKKIDYIGNRQYLEDFITKADTYTYLETYVLESTPDWNLQEDTYSYLITNEPNGECFLDIDVLPDKNIAYYVAEGYFMNLYDYAIQTEKLDNINHDGVYKEEFSYETGILQHDNEGDVRPSYEICPRDIANGKTWKDLVLDTNSMLVPIFDDVFIQPWDEALIYAHYSLHDISETKIVGKMDEWTGEQEVKDINYRFDKNSKMMMVKLSDTELENYKFVNTYNKYENCYAEMVVGPNDLGYKDFMFSTRVMSDGTKYGFYLIDSHMSNTSDSFSTTGVTPEMLIIDKLKYFKYINGVNIVTTPKYIAAIYKNLLPFIKQQPLAAMSDAKAMLIPQSYQIPLIYSQSIHNTSNGSTETDIKMHPGKIKTVELLRYFHGITPLIVPTTNIDNQWNIKLKDVNKTMLETGNYISTGDTPIYSQSVSIYHPMSFPVYTASADQLEVKDYNNISWWHLPTEYKHYAISRHVLLDKHIEIEWPQKIDYDTMLLLENQEVAFQQFRQRVNTPMKKKWSDDDIKFLLSKYRVTWNSIASGLDHTRTKKLYKMTTVFDLV